jgi:hypothetical protein
MRPIEVRRKKASGLKKFLRPIFEAAYKNSAGCRRLGKISKFGQLLSVILAIRDITRSIEFLLRAHR